MKRLAIISVIAVAIAGVSAYALYLGDTAAGPEDALVLDGGFTYYDIEAVQLALGEHGIGVSKPMAITDNTIDQYCTYFEDGIRRSVDYCTTTVVTVDGDPMGNINLGGSTSNPVLAIANLETPTLESGQDEAFVIFETMIEYLVCDCWAERQSGDYESVSAWLEAAQNFYYDSGRRGVQSKVDNLASSTVSLEITPKEDSVLRTLIILK